MKKQKKKNKHRPLWYTGGLQKQARLFLESVAVLTSAGMDLLSALSSVEQESASPRMKKVIVHIRQHLENGGELWVVLKETRVFPARIVSLIRIGEYSGQLVENLETVVEQLNTEWRFKSRIRTAMLYPAIVLPLTFFVGTGVAWFALPRLSEMYAQMNVELPYLTQLLVQLGDFLAEYGSFFVPIVFFSFVIVLYFLFSFPKTKAIGQIMLARMPIFRRLIREVELARIGYILGNLLSAGIPITEGVLSLRDATTFYSYRKFYNFLYENIEVGNTISHAFKTYKHTDKLIPISIQNLIVTGERSGKLSETLVKIGTSYETKIETSIKDISTIMEPVLLILIGGTVGLIALATLLPIYNLTTLL